MYEFRFCFLSISNIKEHEGRVLLAELLKGPFVPLELLELPAVCSAPAVWDWVSAVEWVSVYDVGNKCVWRRHNPAFFVLSETGGPTGLSTMTQGQQDEGNQIDRGDLFYVSYSMSHLELNCTQTSFNSSIYLTLRWLLSAYLKEEERSWKMQPWCDVIKHERQPT